MNPGEALDLIRQGAGQLQRAAYPTAEFDWFAVDANGHVAVLENAGHLPVPPEILEHPESILSLHMAVARHAPESEIMPNDSLAYASKGLFVYDWSGRAVDQRKGRYSRIAVPSAAIKAEDLFAPLNQHHYAAVYEFSGRFSTTVLLEVEV